jgi:hypothetical protein
MEPQAPTYDHSQDLINQAPFFLLAGTIYGPDATVTKDAAHILAMELKTAGYLDKATKDLLDTAASCMDDELSTPADVSDFEQAMSMYDTLFNVCAFGHGHFLEPTYSPDEEKEIRAAIRRRNQELDLVP